MSSEVIVGDGLRMDSGVVLGCHSDRSRTPGLRLGSDARIRSGSVLYLGTSIGDRLSTGHGVVIREGCSLGDDVSVWTNSVIDYSCRIGNGVKIHTNCYVAQYTEICDDAFLAPGVTIANDLYPGNAASERVMSGPFIGPRAQIGVNATILPFVRIGAGAMIGAGSVVTRDIPEGAVAFGNPAVVHGDVVDLVDVHVRIQSETDSASRFRFSSGQRGAQPAVSL